MILQETETGRHVKPGSSDSPLTPHPTSDDWLDWLRLLRSRRVGPATFHRLLAEYGTAGAALAALPGIARDAGSRDYRVCSRDDARDEFARARRAGAVPLAHGTQDYPPWLAEMPDPPPLLWVVGDPAVLRRPAIAMVGARNASSLGLRMARGMARGLAGAGRVIVSGLARGIDTACHDAALTGGTVAVMAGGVDVIYPTENEGLARRIAETGCLVSDQPMGMRPQARHFPRRNRLIAGLCPALVVVEAAAKSGSLITAREALDLGRDVLAVPGHPFDPRASGGNMLIRDGAILVRGAADVLDAVPAGPEGADRAIRPAAFETPSAAPGETLSLAETAQVHRMILDRLSPAPTPQDALFHDMGLPASAISPALTRLELDGLVARDPGGFLRLSGAG